MPLVNVMVNQRAYTIACDDGQEDHLKELADFCFFAFNCSVSSLSLSSRSSRRFTNVSSLTPLDRTR